MQQTAGSSLYDIPLTAIDGTATSLSPYRGRVLVIVNVASRCGFTGQYAGLEQLHRDLHDQGLTVLGFPCNQFLGQEPGAEPEIADFCRLRYDVSFPLFAKLEVNGPNAHPLYRHLTAARPGTLGTKAVKWNFTKFVVDRSGEVLGRYGPLTRPARLRRRLTGLLERSPTHSVS